MIKVTKKESDIQFYQSQMKLGSKYLITLTNGKGGSNMSPGSTHKQDTVNHMINRVTTNAVRLQELLRSRLNRDQQKLKIRVTHNAFVTRKLSHESEKLIKV